MKLIKGKTNEIVGIDFCGQNRVTIGEYVGRGYHRLDSNHKPIYVFRLAQDANSDYEFVGCDIETNWNRDNNDINTYLRAKYVGPTVEKLMPWHLVDFRKPLFELAND